MGSVPAWVHVAIDVCLSEDSPCCKLRSIGFDRECFDLVRHKQYWCFGESLLQGVEGILFGVFPMPWGVLLGEIVERLC